jgi:hypothetical protein
MTYLANLLSQVMDIPSPAHQKSGICLLQARMRTRSLTYVMQEQQKKFKAAAFFFLREKCVFLYQSRCAVP